MQILYAKRLLPYSEEWNLLKKWPTVLWRFRLIPFLTELRAVMDWVWTDTTLSLSSWICVEDIYAHIFVLKCWRESEKVRDWKQGLRNAALHSNILNIRCPVYILSIRYRQICIGPMCECVCVYGALWCTGMPFRVYSHVTASVPGIGSRSVNQMTVYPIESQTEIEEQDKFLLTF